MNNWWYFFNLQAYDIIENLLKFIIIFVFWSECELPEEALKVVKKEIKRLKQMPQHSPEYPMLRNYIELVSDLPWNKSSMEVIDIHKAKEVELIIFSITVYYNVRFKQSISSFLFKIIIPNTIGFERRTLCYEQGKA